MSGRRQTPINPFLEGLMKRSGYETLKDLSEAAGIPYTSLVEVASPSYKNRAIENHQKIAEALGLPLGTLIEGMVAQH